MKFIARYLQNTFSLELLLCLFSLLFTKALEINFHFLLYPVFPFPFCVELTPTGVWNPSLLRNSIIILFIVTFLDLWQIFRPYFTSPISSIWYSWSVLHLSYIFLNSAFKTLSSISFMIPERLILLFCHIWWFFLFFPTLEHWDFYSYSFYHTLSMANNSNIDISIVDLSPKFKESPIWMCKDLSNLIHTDKPNLNLFPSILLLL